MCNTKTPIFELHAAHHQSRSKVHPLMGFIEKNGRNLSCHSCPYEKIWPGCLYHNVVCCLGRSKGNVTVQIFPYKRTIPMLCYVVVFTCTKAFQEIGCLSN
jgi:hypothetical protein